jgi:hypothetical protein
MLVIRTFGAQAPKELPPAHPECKVVFRFQILARAKALLESGDFLEAEQLSDALLCAFKVSPPYNKS